MCIHKGPGKFSSCTDEYMYMLTPDDEVNIGDTWYGRIKWPFLDFKDEEPLNKYLYDTGHTFDKEEEECILNDLKTNHYSGVIVEETSNGFVNVKYYSSKHDVELDWDKVLAEQEEYYSGYDEGE